jgi:peptidase E
MTGHIVPMGAGLAVMQRRDDPLHDYVLELTDKDDPVVLFLGTATGDDNSYIVTFYEAFHSGRCRPRHLKLFHRDYDDLTDIVLGSDVIHVGGGNTANMLDVWHRQGVDVLLHEALERGAVLTGGSAGGLCWFEGGTTDSFGPTLALLHEGLGMIKASYCPHYDAEDQRGPLFHAALLDGSLQMGYASWNRVAIRFTAAGELVEAVTSEDGGRALKVYVRDGAIVEEDIPCRRLEDPGVSRSVST